MHGKDPERWAKVAGLAANQHGVVAVWQLLASGQPRGWLELQTRKGRLHRVYRGVYAVGHSALTEAGQRMAAVLACRSGAALSLWHASAHWELLNTSRAVIDISVPRDVKGPKGIRVHCVRLDPQDVTRRHNIPITTVPRTLLDLAAVATERQLARATNQAVRAGLLTQRDIADMCERHKGRKGMAAFRAVTAAIPTGTRQTRSDLEVAFLRLCRQYEIERPLRNRKVEGYTVDFYWPHANAIVETDGYDYHRTPHEFDSDRRKWAHLQREGYNLLVVGDAWFNSDPADVAQHVKDLIARNVHH